MNLYEAELAQNVRLFVLNQVKNPDPYSRNDPWDSIDQKWKEDEEIKTAAKANWIRWATECDNSFQIASWKIQGNKDCCIAAIMKNGNNLRYASSEMKADKEVVLLAVRTCDQLLKCASYELQQDKEVVCAAFTEVTGDNVFNQLSSGLKEDSDILAAYKDGLIKALSQTGNLMLYQVPSIRNDKEIILAALSYNGNNYECLSKELKEDENIARAAISSKMYGAEAVGHLPTSIKLNVMFEPLLKDLFIKYLAENGYQWQLFRDIPSLSSDRKLLHQAVLLNVDFVNLLSDELKEDRVFMLSLIQERSDVYWYTSEAFQADPEFKKAGNIE